MGGAAVTAFAALTVTAGVGVCSQYPTQPRVINSTFCQTIRNHEYLPFLSIPSDYDMSSVYTSLQGLLDLQDPIGAVGDTLGGGFMRSYNISIGDFGEGWYTHA